jgi:hypothetical protein
LAKTNYSWERHQREVARKKKQEEKLKRRTGKRADAGAGEAPAEGAGGTEGAETGAAS